MADLGELVSTVKGLTEKVTGDTKYSDAIDKASEGLTLGLDLLAKMKSGAAQYSAILTLPSVGQSVLSRCTA